MKSFKLPDACNDVLSKPEILKLMGKICSYVVLFLINGTCSDSVKLESISKVICKIHVNCEVHG